MASVGKDLNYPPTAVGGIKEAREMASVSKDLQVVGYFRCKCPINFSLSGHYDKLKLIGHQTDPLGLEVSANCRWWISDFS